MKSKLVALGLVAALGLSGCITPGVKLNPPELTRREQVMPDTVVVLIAVRGPGAIDYIQLGHSGLPAMNFRIAPVHDGVVALPVPVGLKDVCFGSVTLVGRPGGYFALGGTVTRFGYRSVKSEDVDLPQPGVFFLGAIDTSEADLQLHPPTADEIAKATAKYRALVGNAAPLNFAWDGSQVAP